MIISSILSLFTTREIVAFLYFVIFWFLVAIGSKTRGPFGNLIQTMLKKQLVIAFILIVCYGLLWMLAIAKMPWWEKSYSKDWILGLIIIGTPIVFNSFSSKEGDGYLKNLFKESCKASYFAECLINLQPFPFVVELLLQPLILVLLIVGFYSERQNEKRVQKVCDNALALLGIYILIFTIYRLIKTFGTADHIYYVYSMLVPFALIIIYSPAVYFLNLFEKYYKILKKFKYLWRKDLSLYSARKWDLINLCGLSIRKLSCFQKEFSNKMYSRITAQEWDALMSHFREYWKQISEYY